MLRALASAPPSGSSSSRGMAAAASNPASVALTARVGSVDIDAGSAGMYGLYRRGLVYYDVPVGPDDRFFIPPLEGFVSNRCP